MPRVSLQYLIGTNIRANRDLQAFNLPQKPNRVLFTIKEGGNAGKIYSWVERPDGIWLMFERAGGSFYYIKADIGNFAATDQVIRAYQREKQQMERQKMQEKGAIAFYIEKYGIWVIGAVLASVAIREYIKKK